MTSSARMIEWYANQSAAYDPPDYPIGEEVNLVGQRPDPQHVQPVGRR